MTSMSSVSFFSLYLAFSASAAARFSASRALFFRRVSPNQRVRSPSKRCRSACTPTPCWLKGAHSVDKQLTSNTNQVQTSPKALFHTQSASHTAIQAARSSQMSLVLCSSAVKCSMAEANWPCRQQKSRCSWQCFHSLYAVILMACKYSPISIAAFAHFVQGVIGVTV